MYDSANLEKNLLIQRYFSKITLLTINVKTFSIHYLYLLASYSEFYYTKWSVTDILGYRRCSWILREKVRCSFFIGGFVFETVEFQNILNTVEFKLYHQLQTTLYK